MNSFSRKHSAALVKWPFLLGDAMLVGTALLIAWASPGPLTPQAMGWCVLAVGWGAVLGATPFLAEYWAGRQKHAKEDDKLMLKLYQLEFRLADLEQRGGLPAGGLPQAGSPAAESSTDMAQPLPKAVDQKSGGPGTPLMRKALSRQTGNEAGPAISRIIRGQERNP